MKPVRLLPVLVTAIAAVLVLKTTGLVTHGAYVLTGTSSVQAQEHGGAATGAAAGADATITFPPEPTLVDDSPVLADTAPTVGQDPQELEASHDAAAAAEAGNGEAAPAAALPEPTLVAQASLPEVAVPAAPKSTAELLDECAATIVPAEGAAAPAADHGAPAAPADPAAPPAAPVEGVDAPLTGMAIDPNCIPADALPVQRDASGNLMPISTGQAGDTEAVLLQRLSARRDELTAYEEQLALREALVDAAEKRIEERTTTLQALEDQIAALVDERKAMEDTQFAGVVAMYGTMKPKDAAIIFDTLEMDVLLRVAKAMSARKMAPIMALMTPERAQELTVAMSTVVTDPPENMTPEALASLPQIVGQ